MNDQEPTVLPGTPPEDGPPEDGPPEDTPPDAPGAGAPPRDLAPEDAPPGGESPRREPLGGEPLGGESPEPAERPSATASPRNATAGTAPRILGYLAAAVGGGLLVGLVLFAAGALGAGGTTPSPSPSPSATPASSPSPTASAGPTFVDGQAVGQADAPVTITIWADYQCPYCKLEAFAFGGALEREFAGSGLARIVFRDFAFLGQESLDAAVAARCAGRQDAGAYWRYHDLLFLQQQGENQGAFVRQNLLRLASFAGLDAAAFTACLDDPAVREAVMAETAEGRAQGVESTPTTIVTGPGPTQVMRGFTQDWSELADAVERAANPGATPTPGASSSPTPAPTPTPAASPSASAGASPGGSPTPSAAPSPESSAGSSPTPSP